MNDFDYTGYGPTSAGRAPSAAELRRATYNRYHSSRAIQAMQYIDPATIAASERMVQLGMGADKSPQAVRRTLHGTAAGQATLDAAFAARSAGFLGYGDPRQYSANITQMMSGGLRASIRGGNLDTSAGRMQGFNQRVSGNGAIVEQAAITMQKKLLDNLYGEGEQADPRRLNGYDMTEASQVAARIVGRRGMGNVVHLEKNADFGTRMAAAKQSEVDPNVRAGLSALTKAQEEEIANAEVSGDSGELDRVLDKITSTMSDPKAREALKNIAKSKDALVFNDKSAKMLADTVKEVTKGMAALNDIYGDLSSDDAHAMLEQLNGGRITNKQQARAAARTVDDMRNAAEYAGIDPKQIMGMFAEQQQSLSQRVGNQLGLDERDEGTRERLGSKLASKFAIDATISSKNMAEASEALGLAGDGRSAREIAADNEKMLLEANENLGGYVYSQGDMAGLSDEKKAIMREKAKQVEEASARGDETEMKRISNEMEKIVGPDFAKQVKSGIGKSDMESAQVKASEKIRNMTRTVLKDNYGLMDQLADLDRESIGGTIKNIGGEQVLSELVDIEKIKPTEARIKEVGREKAEKEAAQERSKQIEQVFDKRGLSSEQRAQAKKQLYNEDGSMKDNIRDYAEIESAGSVNKSLIKDLAAVEKIKPTEKRIKEVGREKAEKEAAQERSKQIEQVFDKQGISSEQRAQTKKQLYNEDGSMKEQYKNYAEIESSEYGSGLSKEQAEKFNQMMLNKMGGAIGLGRLAAAEKIKPTEDRIKKVGRKQAEKEAAEDRAAAIKKTFDDAELTEEERATAMKVLYNEDGTMKENVKDYAFAIREVDYTAGQGSTIDKNMRAEMHLKNLEKNDKRQRMADKDNKVSVRGVARAMLSGDVENPFADADAAGATLDALKSAGVPLMVEAEEEYTKEDGTKGTRKVQRDMTDMYTSGLKLDNLDEKAIAQIDKAAGGKVNLVERINKKLGTNMTQAEFIEKSKTDKKLQDTAYTELAEAGQEMDFKVGGSRDNISVMNNDVGALSGKFNERLQKLATLESVSGFVGEEEMKNLTTSVLQGNEVDIGDLIKADEYDEANLLEGEHDKVKLKDGKYGARLKNSGKFQAIADITKTGDKRKIADVAGMMGDDGIAAFEKQIKTMETALASGDVDPKNAKMVDDKGVERELSERSINEMKVALSALKQQADESKGVQTIGTMTVTKLEVTGDFNSSKK